MKPRWLPPLLLLGLLLAWAGWRALRPPPPPPAPPTARAVLPARPFEVEGRVLDEKGAPVPDAEVALFGDRATWLDTLALFGRPSDNGRNCTGQPLACWSDDARADVLGRLDAGTLPFPERLAHTRTDARGRFALPTSTRDAFVVAWKGPRLALGEAELRPWEDVTLSFSSPDEETAPVESWTTSLLLVNPFTRQVQRFTADDWDARGVPLERSAAFPEGAPPMREVGFTFVAPDGGLVDGTVELDCGPGEYQRASTDGGHVTVRLVDRNLHCRFTAMTDALVDRSYVLAGKTQVTPHFSPRRRLTVRWSPAEGAPASVAVDYPPTGGIGDLGTRSGPRPGGGVFRGGVAVFDALWVKADVRDLVVRVERPGAVGASTRVTVGDAPVEVSLTLEPAPGAAGVLVDADGHAVAGLVLDARLLDGGYEGWAETDERGRFALSSPTREPLRLTAHHPMIGSFDFRTDAHEDVVEASRAAAVTLAVTFADGGVAANQRVFVLANQVGVNVSTSDAGEVLLPGLLPGADTVEVRHADEARQGRVTLDVPDSGALRVRVRLDEPLPAE